MDVEKRSRKESILEKTVQALDLPADVLVGLPRVELTGDREVWIENHRGILAYGEEEILVSGGSFVIKLSGSGLKLRSMTGWELLVTGVITAIELT